MLKKLVSRSALGGIALVMTGVFLSAPGVTAGQRYAEKPPVILSPDLTEPWLLQLNSKRKAKVTVRSSRSFTQKEKRHARRKAKQAKRKYRKQKFAHAAHQNKPRYTQQQRSRRLPKQFLPKIVEYNTKQRPGTIVIDTNKRYLYLVMANGKARRYGVGVGKLGFGWTGSEKVTRKAEWPSWRPPAEMIARERKKGRILPTFMPGGIENPLGARAIYLGSTLYRIHGTNAPWTIGQAVSSGCFRMRNEDVKDLYSRIGVGIKVVVI